MGQKTASLLSVVILHLTIEWYPEDKQGRPITTSAVFYTNIIKLLNCSVVAGNVYMTNFEINFTDIKLHYSLSSIGYVLWKHHACKTAGRS